MKSLYNVLNILLNFQFDISPRSPEISLFISLKKLIKQKKKFLKVHNFFSPYFLIKFIWKNTDIHDSIDSTYKFPIVKPCNLPRNSLPNFPTYKPPTFIFMCDLHRRFFIVSYHSSSVHRCVSIRRLKLCSRSYRSPSSLPIIIIPEASLSLFIFRVLLYRVNNFISSTLFASYRTKKKSLKMSFRMDRRGRPWQSSSSALGLEWFQAPRRGHQGGGTGYPATSTSATTEIRGLPRTGSTTSENKKIFRLRGKRNSQNSQIFRPKESKLIFQFFPSRWILNYEF